MENPIPIINEFVARDSIKFSPKMQQVQVRIEFELVDPLIAYMEPYGWGLKERTDGPKVSYLTFRKLQPETA